MTTEILTLSHSQMETWQQCPRRWRLTKIERVRQAPAEALIFGDAVHQAIEADGVAAEAGQARFSLPQLVAQFSEALATRLMIEDPYHLLVFRATGMRLRGLALLRAYHEQFQASYQPSAVEAPFPAVNMPALSGSDSPEIHFSGRIDARVGDSIIDFKTAGKAWAVGIEHEKPQATAYLWADFRAKGGASEGAAQAVRFVVFSTVGWERRSEMGYDAQVDIRTTTRTVQQIGMYQASVRQVSQAITRAKHSDVFPARTGPLCGWCGCLGSCAEGQAWLRSKRRTPAVPLVDGASGAPLMWSDVRSEVRG